MPVIRQSSLEEYASWYLQSSIPVGLDGKGYLLIDYGEDAGEHRWMPTAHLLEVVVRLRRDFSRVHCPVAMLRAETGPQRSEGAQDAARPEPRSLPTSRLSIANERHKSGIRVQRFIMEKHIFVAYTLKEHQLSQFQCLKLV
jgi:hypothetical protein